MVDALEDDLVKRYENEKKEKESKGKAGEEAGPSNFMIFERHFEDKQDEANNMANGALTIEEEIKKEDLSMSSGGGCGNNN